MAEKNLTRNAEIVSRRMAGEWPHEIAASLGMTRNAVIGVLWRAGACSEGFKGGTLTSGERSGTAKLTWPEVQSIRAECDRKGYRAIAERYGVSESAIGHIARGDTWKAVP